jgi:hypothetical protein
MAHKGEVFGEFQPHYDGTQWFKGLPLGGGRTRLLNRMLTGHDFSPYWLSVMGKEGYEGRCDRCDKENTSRHILFECGKWLETRERHGMDSCGSVAEVVRKQLTSEMFCMMDEIGLKL